jgi:hypothetical protein
VIITCKLSEKQFEISKSEKALREKLGAMPPKILPRRTFQQLLSFWPNFAMHKRVCDFSGKDIISVYNEHCPYPVWNKEDWLQHACPPSAEFDFSSTFFTQIWKLFKQCPIPHTIEKENSYSSHFILNCENCHYSYKAVEIKNSVYCVYSHRSELCADIVHCSDCYSVKYAINSKNCRDSSFIFDCENCEHCLFCWNLRNKKYCIENIEVDPKEFFQLKEHLKLHLRANYLQAINKFKALVAKNAYWKAVEVEDCEDSSGNYLCLNKSCMNCYFLTESTDCANIMRGYNTHSSIDCVGIENSSLCYLSVLVTDNSQGIKCCYNVSNCKQLIYSAHCYNCEHCFACCGLVGKQYCIMNTQYKESEYFKLVDRITENILQEGINGTFFPPLFAANTYDDSLASLYFPLSKENQKMNGFNFVNIPDLEKPLFLSQDSIPNDANDATIKLLENIFWDELAKKEFKITSEDVNFSKQNNFPLPYCHYSTRLKALLSWMYFDGELRLTNCAKTQKSIKTAVSTYYDKRILSLEAYIEHVGLK